MFSADHLDCRAVFVELIQGRFVESARFDQCGVDDECVVGGGDDETIQIRTGGAMKDPSGDPWSVGSRDGFECRRVHGGLERGQPQYLSVEDREQVGSRAGLAEIAAVVGEDMGENAPPDAGGHGLWIWHGVRLQSYKLSYKLNVSHLPSPVWHGSLVTLVAGVDSSTQSVKVVVRDADTGAWVREGRAAHPDGTEVDPTAWWQALGQACAGGLLDGVKAISVAGQQHGMVALDDAGHVVRPALLWNDTRSAQDAADLVTELGGPEAWAQAVGSVPLAAFTVSKVRWMARAEPDNARRTASVMLPHDFLSWMLADQPATMFTDRGDASGTGYWSPSEGDYRRDLLELALGHDAQLPEVASPHEVVAQVGTAARRHLGLGSDARLVIGPGTGDNMGAALALGIGPGDVVVSLGTSGTAFAGSDHPTADPSGLVAGFADATGRFLPLVCTLNAARILTATADLLDVDMDAFAALALRSEPGAGGLTMLPYFDGERTPNLPDARGSLHGLSRNNMTSSNIARAAVEGMLGGLADAVDALVAVGVEPRRVLLVGGAASNPAVLEVAATLVNVEVEVPPAGEYVADGAARQAAWVLAGGQLPEWGELRPGEVLRRDPTPALFVREQYRQAREALYR